MAFLIIGCGYTGGRVARRLLERGELVLAVARDASGLAALEGAGGRIAAMDISSASAPRELAQFTAAIEKDLRLMYAVPPIASSVEGDDAMAKLLQAVAPRVSRLVYISSTRVYGSEMAIDEKTLPVPYDEVGRCRLGAERLAVDGPWPTLVLRSAGIYGPHRGLHVALRRGMLGKARDLDRLVSRVHVADLAIITEAALLSDATGSFPVADDLPATGREVAAYCESLGLPGLPTHTAGEAALGGQRGRRVIGEAVRRLLGVNLSYPSFRTGIPAALAEEAAAEASSTADLTAAFSNR